MTTKNLIREHHIAVYNGKEVVIDYVENPKDEFRRACQRVSDNLQYGTTGYVLTPDGKKYAISTNSRMAKLVK